MTQQVRILATQASGFILIPRAYISTISCWLSWSSVHQHTNNNKNKNCFKGGQLLRKVIREWPLAYTCRRAHKGTLSFNQWAVHTTLKVNIQPGPRPPLPLPIPLLEKHSRGLLYFKGSSKGWCPVPVIPNVGCGGRWIRNSKSSSAL